MPRTAKKGFTYYGFDTDHFYDPKVKRLKNKFGMEGWAVFHFIVNEIHRVEGYYMIMDSDGLFDVSDYSRMDEQRIAGIVDYCAELGLFDKGLWRSRQVLTSEEIQNRYMGICKSIHRKPSISDDYLLLNAAAPAATSSPQVAAPCPATHTAPVAEPARSGEKEKDTELMQAIADFKRRLQEPESSAGVVREESGIIRENRPQNKIKENISSPNPSREGGYTPEREEERNSLSGKLQYLGVDSNIIQWVRLLKSRYPDFPIEKAIRDMEQSNFQLTKENYLYPLIKNYIAKYNAEHGSEERARQQEEILRTRRKTLELLGVPVKDQQEILQLASVAPLVLDTALKETWGNKKIKSPTMFLLSPDAEGCLSINIKRLIIWNSKKYKSKYSGEVATFLPETSICRMEVWRRYGSQWSVSRTFRNSSQGTFGSPEVTKDLPGYMPFCGWMQGIPGTR